MKVKEIIKRLEDDGWKFIRQKGSHKVYKKDGVPEIIVVPDHGGAKEPSIGVFNDIKKKAGWK